MTPYGVTRLAVTCFADKVLSVSDPKTPNEFITSCTYINSVPPSPNFIHIPFFTAMSNIPEHHLNSTKTLFGNPWDAQTREEECNEISPNTSNSSWLQNLNILPSILTDLPVERAKDFSNHKIISKIVVKPDFSGYLKGGYNLKATWLGHAVCHFTLPKLQNIYTCRARMLILI